MKILFSKTQSKEFPYPRLDEEHISGLDSDFVVLEKIELARPEYEPLTQELRISWVADYEEGTYKPVYEIRDLPAERIYPNWTGLFLDLRNSEIYRRLVEVELQYQNVSAALTKVIAAIQFGISQKNISVEMENLCKDGLQAALDLLFQNLLILQINLTAEEILSVRNFLDKNSFENISLNV